MRVVQMCLRVVGVSVIVFLFAAMVVTPTCTAVADEYVEIPAPQMEIITQEPGPDHFWIEGHWKRENGDWVWVKGYWAKPVRKEASWVKGHWVSQGDEWVWVEGHWAIEPHSKGYIVPTRYEVPKTVYVEEKPAAPGSDYVWVAGRWEWHGDWEWIPGVWVKQTHKEAVWVPGEWKHYTNGILGHNRWIPGHWEIKK